MTTVFFGPACRYAATAASALILMVGVVAPAHAQGDAPLSSYLAKMQELGSLDALQDQMRDAAAEVESAGKSFKQSQQDEESARREAKGVCMQTVGNADTCDKFSFAKTVPQREKTAESFKKYQQALANFQAAKDRLDKWNEYKAQFEAARAEEAAAANPPASGGSGSQAKTVDQPPQGATTGDDQGSAEDVAALIAAELNQENLDAIKELIAAIKSGDFPSDEAQALLQDVARQQDITKQTKTIKQEVQRHRRSGGGGQPAQEEAMDLPPGGPMVGIGMMPFGFGGMGGGYGGYGGRYGGRGGGGFSGSPHQGGGVFHDPPR